MGGWADALTGHQSTHLAEGPALCHFCQTCIIKLWVQAQVNLPHRRQYSSKGLHVPRVQPNIA
jgi:hypothetical protein